MSSPNTGREFLKAHVWKRYGGEEFVTDQGRGLPRPEPEKAFQADAELIDLVDPKDFVVGDVSIKDVIRKRRSRRKFTDEPLSLEELSYLLWATQGVTKSANLRDGILTYRTVPAGGALQPFETYLAISRVTGVEPGLYRYLPMEHKLLPISAEPGLMERVAAGCAGQGFVADSAVVFIWTCIPYRKEWRYAAASHKIIAQDSGHLCQNLYLAAESIGAGTCAIGAYFQEELDTLLGVDGDDEFTIYVAPVGKLG